MDFKVVFKHITGLRAIAILAVVLYHLDSSFHNHGFNGYLGVEIFFVISGFLLLRSLANDTDFSLKKFILKKIVRLYTPIIFLLLILLPALLLTPSSFTLVASNTAISTLLGVSNEWLKLQSDGYFNLASATNPLLHTWYVSALMQMFIICGAGRFILKHYPRHYIRQFFFTAGFVSFVWWHFDFLSTILQNITPDLSYWFKLHAPNYYDTLPRLWQLLAAGLILKLPNFNGKIAPSLLSLGGLALVTLPILNAFTPQLHALSVVTGTIFIIKYAPSCFLNALLNLSCLQYLGKISFSLYLVHVPLIVLCRQYFSIKKNTLELDAIIFVIILLVAILFYYGAEKRKISSGINLLLFTVLLTLYGLVTQAKGIVTPRQSQANDLLQPLYSDFTPEKRQQILRGFSTANIPLWENMTILYNQDYFKTHSGSNLFVVGNAAVQPSFVLIGDSHAAAIFPGMNQVLKKENISGIYIMSRYIPFFSKTNALASERGVHEKNYMQKRDSALLSWLKEQENLKTVVVALRWATYLKMKSNSGEENRETSELRDMCGRFHSIGKNVVLMTDIPEMKMPLPINYSMQSIIFGKKREEVNLSISTDDYKIQCQNSSRMLAAAEQQGLCKLLHVEEGLKSERKFFGVRQGEVLYYDDNHVSAQGATAICEKLKQNILMLLQS